MFINYNVKNMQFSKVNYYLLFCLFFVFCMFEIIPFTIIMIVWNYPKHKLVFVRSINFSLVVVGNN